MSSQLTSSSSEASRLLEAALEQMDGIIQGARFDFSQYSSSPCPSASAVAIEAIASPAAEDRLPPNSASAPPISDALQTLRSAILCSSGTIDLIDVDTDLQEFVFNWLKNNLMIAGLKLSDQAEVVSLEEKLMQLENDKENLVMELGLVNDQLRSQARRIADLEQQLDDKHSPLRQAQDKATAQPPSPTPAPTILSLQSELAQVKSRCGSLEKENRELRNLLGGDRTPKYLPIQSCSPMSSSSTPDSSPVGRKEIVPDSLNFPPSKPPAKGFRKIFGKIKRSNSGGHLEDASAQTADRSALSKRPGTPEHFRRGGFRATAGGRLGWPAAASTPLTGPGGGRAGVEAAVKKPFSAWSASTIGIWMDSLGLGMYVADMEKVVSGGDQFLKMSMSDLELRLNIKDPMHRKKLFLALLAKQEGVANPDSIAAQGALDHHWVARWLDKIGLPQYKETFLEALVDGRVLNVLTVDDLLMYFKISNQLHHLSLRRGIQVLRMHRFDSRRLDERIDQCPVLLWSAAQVTEWLRAIDLNEYASNLQGTGVHGGLIMLEPRFNEELLAALLLIPAHKTLLRRHLSTQFKELVGREVMQEKRHIEHDPSFVPLTPNTKAKGRHLGQFSLKRKKSKSHFDYEDLVCPMTDDRPGLGGHHVR